MQLMSDAVMVLGSRHGLFIHPAEKRAYVVRCGAFQEIPCELQAGLTVNGTTRWLPLRAEGEAFSFCDQDISPCGLTLTGIDPESALKLELTVKSPFRPRDPAFSTSPVLDLELRVKRLSAQFRWTPQLPIRGNVEISLALVCPDFGDVDQLDQMLRWSFTVNAYHDRSDTENRRPIQQEDAWVVHRGEVRDGKVCLSRPPSELEDASIHLSWCTWSEPMMRVHGEPAPFKYTENFASLREVIDWVRREPLALKENAARVDGIMASHNLSRSTSNLMALTLHAWLANTWWCRGSERDWFTVWEGSCYFHSTVDVEYTQTPFYLAVWPELLAMELDEWPDFVVPGDQIIGDRAKGTVVFMHDIGQMSDIDTTRYNHPMPVEENTNYVLMSYAYWRRSGDDSRVHRHAGILRQALDFVLACDTTGNGVPDLGTSNTIDDASPAVQFGKEQVYLAVKAMAAFETGADMLAHAGDTTGVVARYREAAAIIADALRERAWLDDHFVTLLDASAEGVKNEWTGETFKDGVLPGWDAAHIYTINGLTLLDMIGRRLDISEEQLTMDLRVATERCLDKYGCRHSDFEGDMPGAMVGEGGDIKATCRIGWISMNLLRDLSALYRGVDLRALMDRYWEFQVVVNTQGAHLFFETFNGNNLMTYPRGIVVWGYFDAVAGARLDHVTGACTVAPYDNQVRVPLLLAADWEAGVAPMIDSGRLRDPGGLLQRAGFTPG